MHRLISETRDIKDEIIHSPCMASATKTAMNASQTVIGIGWRFPSRCMRRDTCTRKWKKESDSGASVTHVVCSRTQTQLNGRRSSREMFRTVLGHLQGVYTWECDHFPSEEEIREGMCVRVVRDCSRLRRRDRCTEVSGWHGGWTREGIGIFTTDVRSTSLGNRTRRLGRATVMVRTPRNSGSRTWNGIAC